VKHTVGSGVTTACACTVDLSQVTCGGWLSIYGSQVSCSGSPVVRLPVDGTCHPMSGVEAGDSYEYAPSFVGTVSCSAVADGGDDITNPGTVCCPQ